MRNKAIQSKSSLKPKGDRMHWTPLHESQAVTLTKDLTIGRQLDASDLSKRKKHTPGNNLIP